MRWQKFRRLSALAIAATTTGLSLVIPAIRSPGASLPAAARRTPPVASLSVLPSRSQPPADSQRNRLQVYKKVRDYQDFQANL